MLLSPQLSFLQKVHISTLLRDKPRTFTGKRFEFTVKFHRQSGVRSNQVDSGGLSDELFKDVTSGEHINLWGESSRCRGPESRKEMGDSCIQLGPFDWMQHLGWFARLPLSPETTVLPPATWRPKCKQVNGLILVRSVSWTWRDKVHQIRSFLYLSLPLFFVFFYVADSDKALLTD